MASDEFIKQKTATSSRLFGAVLAFFGVRVPGFDRGDSFVERIEVRDTVRTEDLGEHHDGLDARCLRWIRRTFLPIPNV